MKQVCEQTNLSYQTLKYYCNEGLIPNVKRDHNNHRIFDERNVKWIKDLSCLKKCGMSIQEMKDYLDFCLEGPSTILERKEMLKEKQAALLASIKELEESVDYINWKQNFYDDVLSGKTPYVSNLIRIED
jgi:DNA-binding transcriptional MerR regulator